MKGSESLDITKELRMPRAPYENVSARPGQLISVVQRKWFYLWFPQPHYSMDAGTTQLPARSKRRKVLFRGRILVQAQWRSGRRRRDI